MLKYIFTSLLTQQFNMEKLIIFVKTFTRNLVENKDSFKRENVNNNNLDDNNYISYIGKYISNDDEFIGIFAIKMGNGSLSQVENNYSRKSYIRRYMARLFDIYKCDAMLVAFYNEQDDSVEDNSICWKLAYVRNETNNNICSNISMSVYMAGENQPIKFATKYLLPILEKFNPTMKQLEEGFNRDRLVQECLEEYMVNNGSNFNIEEIYNSYNLTSYIDEPDYRIMAINMEDIGRILTYDNYESVAENINDKYYKRYKNNKINNIVKNNYISNNDNKMIRHMCHQVLLNYMESKTDIPREDLQSLMLCDEDSISIPKTIFDLEKGVIRLGEIDELLANIKIIDIAIGSGVYLINMLDEIVRIRHILSEYMLLGLMEDEKDYYMENVRKDEIIKYNTLENCVYALDTESIVVEFYKIRLDIWCNNITDGRIIKDYLSKNNIELKIPDNCVMKIQDEKFISHIISSKVDCFLIGRQGMMVNR